MGQSKRTKSRKTGKAKAAHDPRQMGLFDTLTPATAPVLKVRTSSKRTASKARASGVDARAAVLSAREAAQYLGVSVSTLKTWRAKKAGPLWVMRGARLIAYRPADLERFLEDSSAKR
jgi:predicted DNA-binding transcriptional regulator AlpA